MKRNFPLMLVGNSDSKFWIALFLDVSNFIVLAELFPQMQPLEISIRRQRNPSSIRFFLAKYCLNFGNMSNPGLNITVNSDGMWYNFWETWCLRRLYFNESYLTVENIIYTIKVAKMFHIFQSFIARNRIIYKIEVQIARENSQLSDHF